MTETLTGDQLAALRALIGDAKPATDALLQHLAEAVRDRREHKHPQRDDLYCFNLVAFAGERMAYVIRRLADAEAELTQLRGRVAELQED